MNTLRIFTLSFAVLLSLISCKEKASETLPREAYSGYTGGVIVRSAPDSGSQAVAVIPFAEKFTLTENSDMNKSAEDKNTVKWYRTQWNGKTGWVDESSAGAEDSVTDQIRVSFNEQKADFSADFIRAFESAPATIRDKYVYPGGEMEPAKILFLSSGIMVINSKIFTENYSNTFFQYEFMNEGKLLKIKFVDSKLNFTDYADMENSSTSVFKIDRNDRSIIYHIKNNSFFFFNWGFHRE